MSYDCHFKDREKNKLFGISVKSISGAIKDPIGQMPPNYKGWMCGEVETHYSLMVGYGGLFIKDVSQKLSPPNPPYNFLLI